MSLDFEMPDAFEWPPRTTMPGTREDPVIEQVDILRQFTPTLEWALNCCNEIAKPISGFRECMERAHNLSGVKEFSPGRLREAALAGIILLHTDLLEEGWPLIQAEIDRLRARVAELEAAK